jgi:peroxiredoxin
MKKIYLAYFLLIALSACGNKDTKSVSLSGEIKGLGNDTLYIYGTDGLYNRMDTLFAKDDKFSATLTCDTLVSTWLQFKDGTEYPLFLNKKNKIKIKGSTADLSSLEITGNTPNEELTAFQKELAGLGKPSEKALEEKAQAFINSHPSSLASIYLLEKYFVQKPQPDFTLIQQLTERMTGDLKDRPYVEELLNRIQEEEKVSIGKTAPVIQLPNAKGEQISRTGTFKDKYLLVHFWASWDLQSQEANAALRRIHKKAEKIESFALWGISLDVDRKDWEEAIKKDTLKWEQTCDFSGWNTAPAKQFAIQALPANILLNPSGRIEGRNMSEEAIDRKLKEIEQKEKDKKEVEKKKKRR